jgi:hypothetical protein
MTWLALRLLRPSLTVAAVLAAAATAYIFHAADTVQDQLDARGVPDCWDPNVCYPSGAAMTAVLGMELIAAFVPALLGLILGVPLFAREREDDTIAFVLTQSGSRRRWVLTKLSCALAAGLLCCAAVATTHRLVGTRYTVLANDTYEGLQLLHLNHIGFMVMLTATLTALAGVVGLSTGRTLRTLVLSVVGGPFAIAAGGGAAALLLLPVAMLTGRTDPTTAADSTANDFRGDISVADGLGYMMTGGLVVLVAVLMVLGPRAGTRAPR